MLYKKQHLKHNSLIHWKNNASYLLSYSAVFGYKMLMVGPSNGGKVFFNHVRIKLVNYKAYCILQLFLSSAFKNTYKFHPYWASPPPTTTESFPLPPSEPPDGEAWQAGVGPAPPAEVQRVPVQPDVLQEAPDVAAVVTITERVLAQTLDVVVLQGQMISRQEWEREECVSVCVCRVYPPAGVTLADFLAEAWGCSLACYWRDTGTLVD